MEFHNKFYSLFQTIWNNVGILYWYLYNIICIHMYELVLFKLGYNFQRFYISLFIFFFFIFTFRTI